MYMASYRYLLLRVATRYCSGGDDRKKKKDKNYEICDDDDQVTSVDLLSVSAVHQHHKNSVVRIVLAGGMVELYAGAVSARLVMQRYPGLCLARPDVFKRPRESLVRSRERLLPGHKFYLVPWSTMTKLIRHNHINNNLDDQAASAGFHIADHRRLRSQLDEGKDQADHLLIEDHEDQYNYGDGFDGLSICSAKDFYVSKEKWGECFLKRLEMTCTDDAGPRRHHQQQEQHELKQKQKQKKPFVFNPPIKSSPVRSRAGVLAGWKPPLSPVKELSP
ncbi:hypothetical protein Cni_G24330 [Canna indica]|uniref:Uncharacterized protein n=1 Tax=Canna indica TaxID=4628 RepID=A0AAQ3KVI3_9LILI|nr:hypothetical protein Cni_G24330 [Canna indica]